MAIPLMLATLTDRREFGDDWLLEYLGLHDDKRPADVVRELPR
jgi:hypothetical protein